MDYESDIPSSWLYHVFHQALLPRIAARKHRQETEDVGTDALVVDTHRHLVEKGATRWLGISK